MIDPRFGVATSPVLAPRALGLSLTLAAGAALLGGLGAGCAKSSCLTGDDEACVVVTPCAALSFTCTTGRARAYVLGPTDPIPPGLDTLASPGDVVLESDQVVAVIDALDHPHHLAPSGGMLLDLARPGGEDALNQALVATGLLPGDTAKYTSLELIETPTEHAVIVRGHLAGDPEHFIATRYEVRPCEPGLRVRSEVVHRGRDPRTWALTDGWFWGGRDLVPFVPLPDTGFEHPSFGLTTVDDVWRDADFLAAASLSADLSAGTASAASAGPTGPHTGPSSGLPGTGASYAVVRCDARQVSGFHSDTISAAGTPRRLVPAGDYEVYERFVAVAEGRGPAPAIDVALEVRRQLHDEPWVTLEGTVTPTRTSTTPLPVAVTVLDGETPRSAVLVGPDGHFRLRVPGPRPYTVRLEVFGQVVDERRLAAGEHTVALVRPEAGELLLDVTVDGAPREAQVFVTPADTATRDAVLARFLSSFTACAPLLGPLHGGSPACNRALVRGPTAVLVPPGRYVLRATGGLTTSLAEARVEVQGGRSQRVTLPLVTLPLVPAGVLSADFHVHGGASFDSALPDTTRVQALLAAGLDVVASTDHDVVSRYGGLVDALGAGGRLHLMTGIESTALVLGPLVPGEPVPKVIGHWNFWPVVYTPSSPYRGGAWDEQVEPGTLFTRMLASGLSPDGVIQLNHPFSAADFGRDLGFPRAVGYTTSRPIPASDADDGTGQALISRVPPAGGLSNLAYHAQEVMNGTDNLALQAHRAYWHQLLSEGIVRAGTANSDSHGLSDAVVGTPRNLVFTRTPYDEAQFLADVRGGRMVGTNGPVILASVRAVDGTTRAPSVEALRPAPGAVLALEVRAPAWVPVTELRVVVDGRVARTITEGLGRAASPTAPEVVTVWRGSLPLGELVPADGRDHWLVVEAGAPLPAVADLDCDGIPDTTDNDGNGVIDARDAEDYDPEDPGEGCDVEVGPLEGPPPLPPGASEARAAFEAVTPGGFPFAFTNPLLLDADGRGFAGAGR